MKRKTFILRLTALVMAALLAGCGGSRSSSGGRTASRYSVEEILGYDENENTVTAVTDNGKNVPVYAKEDAKDIVPYFELRWYINNLSGDMLSDFTAIYKAVSAFDERCDLSGKLTRDEVDVLRNILRYDCPEIFMLPEDDRITYYYNEKTDIVEYVTFTYGMSKEVYEEKYGQCLLKIEEALSGTEGMTDREKEKQIYIWITENCHYDDSADMAGKVTGCLLNGLAKCDGISKTFKWLCEAAGIQCLVVTGMPAGEGAGHAWNKINIDGNFLDVDVTNDCDSNRNYNLYGAYNVSSDLISSVYSEKDVLASYFDIPSYRYMDQSYYWEKGQYITEGTGYGYKLENAVYEMVNGNRKAFTLQFESAEDYTYFMNNASSQIKSMCTDWNASLSWHISSIPDYKVARIIKKEQ